MSRTHNSVRNAATAIGGQMLNNGLRLICRTAFIYTMGKHYLGISSLYANILTILSVTELGFSSAVTYSLYRPLADGDTQTVCALMDFYRKAYRVIGLVILGLGLALIPWLPKLMNGATDIVNIYEYYLLYLAQTVVSYFFFAYKSTLLVADQKKYVTDLVTYVVQISINAVQIVILFAFRSFFLYTVASVLGSAIQNIAVARAADKRYPYLKKPAPPLDPELRKSIFSQVYATSLYKISTVIGVATDNLIISAYINVIMVGMYDNYNMILQVVQKLLQSVFQAVSSSLGNLYATQSKQENLRMFYCLNRLNSWLIVFCSVCFLNLFQPFVERLWGEEYLLRRLVVAVIVGNFATLYLQNVVQIYKNASGLFVRGKYRAVATAVLNLGISIFLVKRIGLPGVFLGSIISRVVTTWWYDAWILFRHGFDSRPTGYYLDCAITLVLAYGLGILVYFLCRNLAATWTDIILRGVVCVTVPNLIYALLYCRTRSFRDLTGRLIALVKRRKA